MEITPEFINSFTVKLPFTTKRMDEKMYLVLSDELFCKIFWIRFYHELFAPLYKMQNRIVNINELDLTIPVYIDAATNLLDKIPQQVRSALYFGHSFTFPESQSYFNLNGNFIFIVAVLLIIIIFALTAITKKVLI